MISQMMSMLRALWDVVRTRIRMLRGRRAELGMSTAEYAVGTVAAVAFAVVLYKVVTSPAVMSALAKIIHTALSVQM